MAERSEWHLLACQKYWRLLLAMSGWCTEWWCGLRGSSVVSSCVGVSPSTTGRPPPATDLLFGLCLACKHRCLCGSVPVPLPTHTCAPIDVPHSSAAVPVAPIDLHSSAQPCLHCLPALSTLTQDEAERGGCVGLDVSSGEPADPHLSGVLDNYIVKRQILQR